MPRYLPYRPDLPTRLRALAFAVATVLTLGSLALAGNSSAVAQAPGGLGSSVVITGDTTAAAGYGGRASNRIGSTDGYSGAGTGVTIVDGSVTTLGYGGDGQTVVGDPSQGGRTVVDGDILNDRGEQRLTGNTFLGGNSVTQPGADLAIGGCGSTTVLGDVFVGGGSLEVGCVCAARRNGQCCIAFHNAVCVLNQVPPGKHGCPPGYHYSGGLCRLYSDFAHRYGQ